MDATLLTGGRSEPVDIRLTVLLEANDALGSSLDDRASLQSLARCLVPRMGDACYADVVQPDGQVESVACAFASPEHDEACRALRALSPSPQGEQLRRGLARALETGGLELCGNITGQRYAPTPEDDEARARRLELGIHALIIAPLTSRGRILGAITLAAFGAEKSYGDIEIKLLKKLASRAALAIDNARLYQAERDARNALSLAATRIARLQAVTALLSEAQTPAQVARVVVGQGLAAVGGATGIVMVLSGDSQALEMLAEHGLSAEARAAFRRVPLDLDLPLCRAVRAGQPELIETHAELAALYPAIAGRFVPEGVTQAVVSIPLIVNKQTIGALGVSFSTSRTFDDEERFLLLTMARQCAQALDRSRLYEVERRANERLTLLAEASELLSSSLDYETTLASVAKLPVPRFSDACVVDLIAPDGCVSPVAIVHADPRREAAIREIRRRFPPHPEASPLFRVVRTRRPSLKPLPSEADLIRNARDDEHAALLREVGPASRILVPLLARGQVLGVLSFGKSGRSFDEDDLSFAEDLARRAALAIDNARLYKEAHEANRSKDEFLSVLSHELRTPLNAILGWASILSTKSPDPKAFGRGIAVIERNARMQAKIIEDILDVSRIITGKLRLECRPIDPASVVRAAVDVLRPMTDAKQVELVCVIAGADAVVSADPDRLQQVVWNLLSNAIKFTPQGGQVMIRLDREGSSARVSVRDSGQGIRPDFLPYVFDRFRQADSSSSRAHGGLGLGLAIVRHLVEMHGGNVVAESEGLGRGSTFTVILPLHQGAITDVEPLTPRPSFSEIGGFEGPVSLDGIKVLIVDDEADGRDLMAAILTERGASVRAAGSASEAIELLPAYAPDVLVSDIGMPGEDGLALIRRVRALPPPVGRVPAVALTAYARPEDVRSAFLAGFQMHVPKPIEPLAFATIMANLSGRVLRP